MAAETSGAGGVGGHGEAGGSTGLGPLQGMSGDGNTYVLLGLFLVVLAFMIVLLSISRPEGGRSAAVIGSVSSTFAPSPPRASGPFPAGGRRGEVLGGEAVLDRLQQLIASQLAIAEIERPRRGDVMTVSMPADALFHAGKARLREHLLPLLDRIVTAISGAPGGTGVEVRLLLGTAGSDARLLPSAADSVALRRAGAWVRAMIGRGIDGNRLAVGLRAQPERQAAWQFRVVATPQAAADPR